MIPRKKLDIGWRDLACGLARCAMPGSATQVARQIEQRWSAAGDALVCLSVRTGFDLALRAFALPPGSEVLMSAITIRDMPRIVEQHALVPIAVDIAPRQLRLDMAALARAVTPRTRAIVVAHLFGSRMPLDDIFAFALQHGLLVFEDCAQAFAGLGYTGDARADVSLFSFGTIKTATALGGALLRARDPAVLARMRALYADCPVQSRSEWAARVVRTALLVLLSQRFCYTLFCALSRLTGIDHDTVIARSVRGFAGPGFFARIRRRPSAPLLALLLRRIAGFDEGSIARRVAIARAFLVRAGQLARPGIAAPLHTHWVVPVRCADPDGLIRMLRREGYDATRAASSLTVLAGADRASVQMMQSIVYLPVYPGVSVREVERLAALVVRFDARVRPLDGSGMPVVDSSA